MELVNLNEGIEVNNFGSCKFQMGKSGLLKKTINSLFSTTNMMKYMVKEGEKCRENGQKGLKTVHLGNQGKAMYRGKERDKCLNDAGLLMMSGDGLRVCWRRLAGRRARRSGHTGARPVNFI